MGGMGGGSRLLAELAELLDRGDQEGAWALAEETSQSGRWQALVLLADLYEERGDLTGAWRAHWRNASYGYARRGVPDLVDFLMRHRDTETRKLFFTQVAEENSNPRVVQLVGDAMVAHNDMAGAVRLFWAAALGGGFETTRRIAELLARNDSDELLDSLVREAVDVDNTFMVGQLAQALVDLGAPLSAGYLYSSLTALGQQIGHAAIFFYAGLLEDTERHERHWRVAAEAGQRSAMRLLAELLEERGDMEEAELHYRRAAEAGDGDAGRAITRILEGRGDRSGAEQAALLALEAGITSAAQLLGELRLEHGDEGDALRFFALAARAGNTAAAASLAPLLMDRGDLDGIEALARETLGTHGADIAALLAEALEQRGHLDRAERVYRWAAELDHAVALARLPRLRALKGDYAEAEHLAQQAADAGNTEGLLHLVRLRAEQGELDQAERLARRAAKKGDTQALPYLVRCREAVGDWDGAERTAQLADAAGDRSALRLTRWRRREAGGAPWPVSAAEETAATGSESITIEDVETAASSVSHALERLFLRLGPPPEAAFADMEPTTGGDGGTAR